MQNTKVYKPEISCCPLCKAKLKYRYTVSNKIITFSNGQKRRIKNLGYSCTNENCLDNSVIYTSQTAVKLCMKGYTYSAKVLAEIAILKHRHLSREEICNKLALNGVEISDRNIDIIYKKYEALLKYDYIEDIKQVYQEMVLKYQQIRLSIDCLSFDTDRVITIRNSFTNDIIGLYIVSSSDISKQEDILKAYLISNDIKEIITTRPCTDFFKILYPLANRNIKFYSYEKF